MDGSGTETIAHLRENGRIVVMLCAFEGPPRIVRLHGRGEVVLPRSAFGDRWLEAARSRIPRCRGRRAIVVVEVTRVSDSCGYGVPLMGFEGQREHHPLSVDKKLRTLGPEGYAARRERNALSLDGLPAAQTPETDHPGIRPGRCPGSDGARGARRNG